MMTNASPAERSRFRVRPSGFVFVIVFVLVQLAAINTGNNLLYLIAGAVVSFVVIGYFATLLNVRRLALGRGAPSAVHRGENFAVTHRLENRKRWLPAISIRVGLFREPPESGAFVEKVPARGAAIVRLQKSLPTRGVHELPPVTVASAFPFGLYERIYIYKAPATVVVYPRVKAVRPTVLEQMHGSGETPKLRHGEGEEFFSLRDYVPGDDLRKIVWRVSARLNHLVVRELEPTTSRNVMICVDTRRAHVENFDEHFEDAMDMAASLAVSFLNRQYSVGLLTPDREVALGEANAHAITILDALARIIPLSREAVTDDWYTGAIHHGPKMGLILISPNPDEWGVRGPLDGTRVLDPREVVHA